MRLGDRADGAGDRRRAAFGPFGEIRVVKRDGLIPQVASGPMTRQAGVSVDTTGSEHIFMGLSRLPSGMRSTAHTHTNCESALYVASGHGRFLVGERLQSTLVIEPGDFIHVPPDAPHVVVNDSDVDLVLLVARNTQVEQVSPYDADAHDATEPAREAPLRQPLLLNRCKTCRVPIRGPLATLSRIRGIAPYAKNPQLCNRCETRIRGSEDCVVTVLFADIRGYTGMTRTSSNDQVLSILRLFFNQAASAVYDYYGVVDQFLGDGLKVLFNVPVRRVTHHEDAVRAALAIQRRCHDASFGVGIGIETGMALAGHIGVETAADFTCIGEAVNHAARLQSLAGPGEIVVGPTLWRKVADLVETERIASRAETVELKGIGELQVQRLTAVTS